MAADSEPASVPESAPAAVPASVLEIEIDSDVEELTQDAFTLELEKQLKAEDETGLPPDQDRVPREQEPWLPLPDPAEVTTGDRAKAAAQLRQTTEKEASAALAANDAQKAVDVYTLAMRTGGATAMMLANRAALLLKLKRPCATIRDCTAALKISSTFFKAHRIRALAHRKLGHWRKALGDVTAAQELKADDAIGELQTFLKAQCAKLDLAQGKEDTAGNQARKERKEREKTREKERKREREQQDREKDRDMDRQQEREREKEKERAARERSAEAALAAAAAAAATPVAPSVNLANDLTKGQAVVLEGLEKAPHLNGKRGVVERSDPRPAARGRWEVEVRLDFGRIEIKSIKRDNISVLNKADREACRVWAQAEKVHQRHNKQREDQEESNKFQKCVDAKISKFPTLAPEVLALVRKLKPEDQLTVLDKVDDKVVNINEFLKTQVALITGDDSDDDEPASKKARV